MVERRYGAAMDQALALAAQAARRGEVPVGAVVLGPGGKVLAQGANACQAEHDPTAHAEILALRAAGSIRDVLRDPRTNHQVEVVAGLRARQSTALLQDFFTARRLDTPAPTE